MDLIKSIQEGQKEGVKVAPSMRDNAMSFLLGKLNDTNGLISSYEKEEDSSWNDVLLDSCIKDKEIIEYLIKKI